MNERLSKLPWVEIAILLLAVVLRFSFLDIKPAHFDEGINGWFADGMTANGYYHYDPTNYHGPLHFYAVFLSQSLLGRSLLALRLPAIIASLLCVWLMLRYRTFLGDTAVRLAATAMAVSPAFVFYGRYSIHESWQVLFSMLMFWGILGMWLKGQKKYFFACVGGFVGMVLTKETYLLHAGSMALAAGTLWTWQQVVPSRPAHAMAKQLWTREDAVGAAMVGVFLIIFFYSGNFQDFPGLKGLYETFSTWINTGVEAAGHDKVAYKILGPLNAYWLMLFLRYELPALAGFGFCLFLVWPTDARLRLLAIYGCGVLLAYSLIPYKTPWCIISIEWPFLLLFGTAAAYWPKLTWPKYVAGALIAASFALSIRLNFIHYTDEKEPYVYVQTYPDIEVLTQPLLEMAKRDPRYSQLIGVILLDSYYPIPWMLGDFPRVGYYKDTTDISKLNPDFVVVEASKAEEIERQLKGEYSKHEFRLRDAMEPCVVYFREPLFREWFREQRAKKVQY